MRDLTIYKQQIGGIGRMCTGAKQMFLLMYPMVSQICITYSIFIRRYVGTSYCFLRDI